MSTVVNYICIVDFKGKIIAAFSNRAIVTVGGQHGSCRRQTVSDYKVPTGKKLPC